MSRRPRPGPKPRPRRERRSALGLGLGLGLGLALCAAVVACASPPATSFPDAKLVRGDTTLGAHAATNGAKETVFVFYSDHCPCVSAHIERLRALQARFASSNVRFWFVDSEVGASTARDAALMKSRNLPFEMLVDADGSFARSAGAEYASYTLVVDASGRIRYHGGIDSDKSHLTEDAEPYLADALQDLVSGRDVRAPEGKALGCSLELP